MRKRRIRGNRGFWYLALGFITVVVIVVGFFLLPPRSETRPVDVVVVLAGLDDGRHALARELVEEGLADNLVVSNPGGPAERRGSSLCRGESRPEGARTWCLNPDPVTTTGEALTFEQLAEEEGWQTAMVVTNRVHARRANINFEQCTSVNSVVISVDQINWVYLPVLVAREIGGFLKHWTTDPCP